MSVQTAKTRSEALQDINNVPNSLKEIPQWLLWSKGIKNNKTGKFLKIPKGLEKYTDGEKKGQIKSGMGNFPLVNFDEAYEHLLKNQRDYTGIGFHCINGIVGIDIDNCFEEGGYYSAMAKDIIDTLDTYTERSPSGNGLRLFVRSSNPPNQKIYDNDIGLEIFHNSNFFTTVTGAVEHDIDVQERTSELEIIINKYLSHKNGKNENGQKEYEKQGKIYEGEGRDNNLTSSVGKWISTGTKDYSDLISMARAYTQQRHEPPLKDKEVERIVNSVLKKDSKNQSGKKEQRQEPNPISFKYYNFDKQGDPTSPKNVYENFAELLKFRDIKIRYNEMSKLLEIDTGKVSYSRDNAEEIYLQDFYNTFVHYNFKGFGKDLIKAMIVKRGDLNRYNPVKDYIENAYKANIYYINKTGTTELDKLYDTLHTSIDFNPNLKKMLIKKWLISCVKAVFSDNGISAHGVLVLQGKQGLGKTTWFKNLCPNPDWFKDGATLDPSNKDSVSGIIKYWLVELGEIESTFKKDLDHLKAFITKDFDELRRPYARAESKYPRRTIFCGSVNGAQFLKDETGSRRFWNLPVIGIDYQTKVDVPRLWAEIKYLEQQGELWYLTKDEESLLSESNKMFEVKNYVDTLIEANFEWEKPCRYWLKSSDIFTLLGQGKELSSEKIGKALSKRGVNNKTKNGYKLYAVPKLKNWHGYWNYEESSGVQVG